METNLPEQNQDPNSFVQKKVGQAPVQGQPVMVKNLSAQASGPGFFKENRWYFAAIILGVLIIAVMAFFVFRKAPPAPVKEANVNLSFENTADTVQAGGVAVYYIHIQNNDTQKLTEVQLELSYPEGFSYVSSASPSKPQNLSGTLFLEPDLISGQSTVTVVQAKVSGNVNDFKTLTARLHYKFSNFNSEFVKQATKEIRLVASDVVLELQAPTTANNSQLLMYTLKYQNGSQNSISSARIRVIYPDGFLFATAQPNPDSGNNIWNFSSLPPGAEGTITIQGNFTSANPGESKTATASLEVLGQDGQYQVQVTSAPAVTAISTLPLLVNQEVDNLGEGGVVNPGDNLTFNIKYQNNGSTAARGVNVLVTLNSKALDLSSLRAEGGIVNNNTIQWNAATVAALQTLNPSDSGQLSFSVKVKNPATKDSSKNLTVVSDIKIKSNEYDTDFPGNQLNLKVSSPISLVPALIFQSGSQPPQVGKPTLYSASLSLINSTNDFSNGLLTAFIPLGAGGFVEGSVSAQEAQNVQYDPSTGKLTWNVGQLPAHTGQFSMQRTLRFGVRIIPSASQAGDQPTLVKDIQFNAKDTFTGQAVSATGHDLTTDSTGSYDGTVQQ